MNIQYQIAGLCLLALVAILMFGQKSLRLHSQAAFMALFFTILTCVCLDVSSVVTIHNKESVGEFINALVCKSYLCSITVVAFMLLFYTFIEIQKNHRNIKGFFAISLIPILLELVILCLYPIYVFNDGTHVYTYGACVSTTYGVALFYLLASFAYTLFYRKQMQRQIKQSVWFLIAAWGVTAFIQMMHNELLLVGFAMCVAIVYMYVTLENPQLYIDRESGVFNSYALVSYLDKDFFADKRSWMAAIQVEGLHFVEENFGVKSGSDVLVRVADFLASMPGEKNKIFRFSENAFCLLFDSQENMKAAVKEISTRFESSWDIQGMNITLECGIICLQDEKLVYTSDEMVEMIHYFLQEAKKRGNGEVIRIDEAEIQQKDKVTEAEKSLRWALDNDRVEVYYQPIYSVKDDSFNTLEALVRIVDEKRQFVMPDVFIPIAEQTGLILELGLRVFEKTCIFMLEEKTEEVGIEYIEINLSVVQCMQEKLAKQLLQIMNKYGVAPNRISLEITETAAIHSEKMLLRNMEILGQHGTTFAIDDYGTGYSNLSYIVNLPIHIIKLDRSMVWAYFSNDKAAIATRHAISMIRELGMKIVAEGVETKQHFETMRELGVDYVQGYYFSKPLPAKDVIPFFNKWNKK